MTIHLERKIARKDAKYPYQRISYDLTDQTQESISEISRVLNEFTKRSDGEFNYSVTGNAIVNESGEVVSREVLYGSDFFQRVENN
jgi:chaperonin cofactor prefoldin